MAQIAIILIMFRGANNFSFLPKNADGERESILLRTCDFLSCEDQVCLPSCPGGKPAVLPWG